MDKKTTDSTQEEERWNRAVTLVKETVAEAHIQDASEYRGTAEYFVRYWAKSIDDNEKPPTRWPETRWSVFKAELTRDVILLIQVNSPDGVFWIETSLLSTAIELLNGAEKIVTAPEFADVMAFARQEEVTKEIDNNVREVLRIYIDHLPAMMAQATERARDDCIERQVKASIEPRLREYCEKFGLPVRRSLTIDWNRESSANELDTFREVFLLRERPQIPEELPREYDFLRQEYKKAKEHYEKAKRQFCGSEEEWVERWRVESASLFPRLARYLLLSFTEATETSRTLAKKHLATYYGVSFEYIRKRISALRPKVKARRRRTSRK